MSDESGVFRAARGLQARLGVTGRLSDPLAPREGLVTGPQGARDGALRFPPDDTSDREWRDRKRSQGGHSSTAGWRTAEAS